MYRFGLIGKVLGHSYSQAYFTQKFENEHLEGYRYDNYALQSIDEVRDMIAAYPELRGFNVTIPYKEAILPFLNELSPEACQVGAVNTVRIRRSDSSVFLQGFNTDVFGFERSLRTEVEKAHLDILENRSKALVLGTGGASKAVCYVLQKLGLEYARISRSKVSGDLTYQDLTPKMLADYPLIINTTPLGMFPKIADCPDIPYEGIGNGHLLFDMIYNPAETLFLHKGACQGASVSNGLQMLQLQAEQSWKIWCEIIR